MKRHILVIHAEDSAEGYQPPNQELLGRMRRAETMTSDPEELARVIVILSAVYRNRFGHYPSSTLTEYFLDSPHGERWIEEDGKRRLVNPDCVQARVMLELDPPVQLSKVG